MKKNCDIRKKYTLIKQLLLFIFFCFLFFSSKAQKAIEPKSNDTIRVWAWVYQGDTLPFWYHKEAVKAAYAPDWLKSAWANHDQYKRLERNVQKVYPYAVASAYIIEDIDANMAKISSKAARKSYKESREKELTNRFKDELKNMTTTQGAILVKLISRQTGKSVFEIIKTFKGGLTAQISQWTARTFDNNLKAEYDPNGEDATIEYIVRKIESSGHFEKKY